MRAPFCASLTTAVVICNLPDNLPPHKADMIAEKLTPLNLKNRILFQRIPFTEK